MGSNIHQQWLLLCRNGSNLNHFSLFWFILMHAGYSCSFYLISHVNQLSVYCYILMPQRRLSSNLISLVLRVLLISDMCGYVLDSFGDRCKTTTRFRSVNCENLEHVYSIYSVHCMTRKHTQSFSKSLNLFFLFLPFKTLSFISSVHHLIFHPSF